MSRLPLPILVAGMIAVASVAAQAQQTAPTQAVTGDITRNKTAKISAVVNCNGFAAGITMSSIEPGSIFFHSTRSARGAADRDKDRPRSLSLCLELDQCIGREIGYHKPIDEPGSDVHRNGATQV